MRILSDQSTLDCRSGMGSTLEMTTLGIETSGLGGSVALVHDGRCVAARELSRSGRRHARTLVAELKQLLGDNGTPAAAIAAVAVSIGPGSFTGLRVGVVCAKTLAYATGSRVVAVDTFLAVAAQAPDDVDSLQVVGDGQRGDLYLGRYQRANDGDWVRPGPIEIRPAVVWLESLQERDVVSGPGLERHLTRAAERCRVLPAELHHPRAETVALLGESLAQRGEFADLWTLEPFYLRRSGAEEKADAAAAAGASPVAHH